ncbi:MAG: hypothetical protein R3B68_04820 [Phycisphaerales bacterium]
MRDRGSNRRTTKAPWLAVGLWALAVAGMIGVMVRYDRSVDSTSRPAAMPAPAQAPPTLVRVYAHPRCPCTAATITVLARLAALAGNDGSFEVLFFRPEDEPDRWAWTENWRAAGAIPGVSVRTDPGGRLAAAAGATTSGHALVSDSEGRVLYSGGLTDGRSDPGFGLSADAVLGCVRSGEACRSRPAFGCAIHDAPPASGASASADRSRGPG